MKHHRIAGIALAVGLSWGLGVANAADVTAYAELGLSSFSKTATQTCVDCAAEVSASIGSAPLDYSATGAASATASYGLLRAFGSFNGFGPHFGVVSNGIRAKASFEDNFIIDKPGLTGTAGVVEIPLAFAWSVIGSSSFGGTSFVASNQFNTHFFDSASNTPIIASFFREDFDGGGLTFQSASIQVGSGSFTGMPFTFAPKLNLSFTYGQVLKVIQTLDISMFSTDFNTSGLTSLFGTNDAGHSAYWGGFAAVRDANGALVENYTVQSGSGTDWSQSRIPVASVPEPGSLAMLIAGLGLVLPLVRRRLVKAKA